ncbi:MAG TPA: hypothetical protein VGD54_01460 [Steroidobacteraceae bacterium]
MATFIQKEEIERWDLMSVSLIAVESIEYTFQLHAMRKLLPSQQNSGDGG